MSRCSDFYAEAFKRKIYVDTLRSTTRSFYLVINLFFLYFFICIFRHSQKGHGTIISIDVYWFNLTMMDDAVHATSNVRAAGWLSLLEVPTVARSRRGLKSGTVQRMLRLAPEAEERASAREERGVRDREMDERERGEKEVATGREWRM